MSDNENEPSSKVIWLKNKSDSAEDYELKTISLGDDNIKDDNVEKNDIRSKEIEYYIDCFDTYFNENELLTISWKRPSEIVEDPCLIENYDESIEGTLIPGILTPPWFPIIIIMLQRKNLVNYVMQDIKHQDNFNLLSYEGHFPFRFFKSNRWLTISIDDRLPYDSQTESLLYCISSNKEEFFPSLMEKAFAKFCNGYDVFNQLEFPEAVVNVTGAIVEEIPLYRHRKIERRTDIVSLFTRIFESKNNYIIVGETGPSEVNGTSKRITLPTIMPNNHFYLITRLTQLPPSYNNPSNLSTFLTSASVSSGSSADYIQMVRIHNPLCTGDWNGRFAIGSDEWESINEATRTLYRLKFEHESEVWLQFSDFCCNMQRMWLFQLPQQRSIFPSSFLDSSSWYLSTYDGSWLSQPKECSGNLREAGPLFLSNPQYLIQVSNFKQCTVKANLSVQSTSNNPKEKFRCGLSVFKVENNRQYRLHLLSNCNAVVEQSILSQTSQSITVQMKLQLGSFVLIPWLEKIDEDNQHNSSIDYFLRVFSQPYCLNLKLLTQDAPEFKICLGCRAKSFVLRPFTKLNEAKFMEPKSPTKPPKGAGNSYYSTITDCASCISENPQVATYMTVVEAIDVEFLNPNSRVSPNSYLLVHHDNFHYRLATQPNTNRPQWNESFIFFRNKPNTDFVMIQLYLEDTLRDKCLGFIKLTNQELSKTTEYTTNFVIAVKSGELVKTATKITLRFQNYCPLKFEMI